jgi:hypothetical protein
VRDYFELSGSFRSAINPRHELFVVARSGHGVTAMIRAKRGFIQSRTQLSVLRTVRAGLAT